MAGTPEAMAWEETLRTRLGVARTFHIEDNILYLYAGDHEAITAVRL